MPWARHTGRELKTQREAQQRELAAWEARWAEERAEDKKKWEALERKWEAQDRKWEAQNKNWEAQNKNWEAQEKKWEENQRVTNDLLASVKAIVKRLDSSIGALGARWGLHSEASFRNGLKAILEESFGVKVIRYEDYDSKGRVFGRPDQIEMDIIIHNHTLILCEIKSSISKSDLYAFWRKKGFYEEKHECKATRSMVISPMIDDKARAAAKELGIEMYSYADSVEI